MKPKRQFDLPPILERKMQEYELSVQRLAREAGVSEQTLYGNLRGQYPMSLLTALSIIDVLKLKGDVAVHCLRELNEICYEKLR